MKSNILDQRSEVKKVKFHHKVKRFYYRNLFRKIYTIAIIGLIGANIFTLFKYQSFADDITTPVSASQGMNGISYNPDAGITYTDTNGRVFSGIGTITLSSGDKSITMLDRNLGAIISGTGEDSYGYHFQWGNNYGFTRVELGSNVFVLNEGISSLKVDTSQNQRNVPYVSPNFIVQPDYSIDADNYEGWDFEPHNHDLWGGSGDYNNGGGDSSADYKRQGPCPAGYHVPSGKELNDLLVMYYTLNPSGTLVGGYINGTTFSTNFREAFNIPLAGARLVEDGKIAWEDSALMVSSSVDDLGVKSECLSIDDTDADVNFDHLNGDAVSLRCFQDHALEDGSYVLILEYETNEGSAIQAQTIPEGENAYLPGYTTHRDGKVLLGWSNEDGTQQYTLKMGNPSDNFVMSADKADENGVVKVYAVWGDCPEGYIVVDNKCVLPDGIIYDADAGISYTDTNGNLFTGGTITITYGGKSITMLDRNLGATSNNRNDESSYGYVFQRGNNYGFNLDLPENTGAMTISADSYGRNNPYVSGTFILSGYWDHSYNGDLRGGTGDYDNARQLDTSDSGYARQGPCPAGYHVPSIGEWDEVIRMYRGLTGSVKLKTGAQGGYSVESNPFGLAFMNSFYIPTPGYLGHNGVVTGVTDTGYSYAYFWSSSFQKAKGYVEVRYSPQNKNQNRLSSIPNQLRQGNAFYLRCFKNTASEGNEITLSYDTRGGSAIQAQTLLVGSTGYLPGYTTHRDDVELIGWYNEDLLTEFDFNTQLNSDTTIYARWSDDYEITFIDGDGNVLSKKIVARGNTPTYTGSTPTKISTSDYIYTFNGQWQPTITAATEDVEYVAQFDATSINKGGNYSGRGGRKSADEDTSLHGSGADAKNITGNKIDSSNNDGELDMGKYDKNYSLEMNKAYQFVYANGITMMKTIKKADMDGRLTRIQMAKMLSNYAINVLGMEPDLSKGTVRFNDVSDKLNKQYDNAVTLSYQLGIMGINMKNNNFRPYDEVTRAEFATALSRMLYGIKDGTGKTKYYVPHIAKLYNEGIITNTNPNMKELRGWVMIILMRSVK